MGPSFLEEKQALGTPVSRSGLSKGCGSSSMLRYQCEYAKSYSGEAYGARVECKQFVSRELRNCELKGPLSRLFVYIIRYLLIKVMEFDLKWVHMARYGLILKQDGALWLRIISKPLLTPKRATE